MRAAEFRNEFDQAAIVARLTVGLYRDFVLKKTPRGATITAPDGRKFEMKIRSGKTFWEVDIDRVCYARFMSHEELSTACSIVETAVRLAALGFNTTDSFLVFHRADWTKWGTTLATWLLDELRTHGRFRMPNYLKRGEAA